ncbi:hypothetical protein B0H19DRAFT_1236643 [Mycena capillaripes]|nr:hypothetical protein B0H19DRAFT_1236643 [Mycena capillaripes]
MSSTPKANGDQFRSGRGLSLPTDVAVPEAIQKALNTAPAAKKPATNRESMQRKQYLPYVVLEFDKNETQWTGTWRVQCGTIGLIFTNDTAMCLVPPMYVAVKGQDDMGDHLLMARGDLTPAWDTHHASDQWYAATTGTGSLHVKIDFQPIRDEFND